MLLVLLNSIYSYIVVVKVNRPLLPIHCETVTSEKVTAITYGSEYHSECVVVLRQSFPSGVTIFVVQNCARSVFTYLHTFLTKIACAKHAFHTFVCQFARLRFQICDDFHYPGAGPPDMQLSSIEFNDSRLRASIDVARCSRAMLSNVSRACRVHGAEPNTTRNRTVWRTPVSQTSACVAFGARRRWRPASLLGSPVPSRSTKNTIKRAARCTRVSCTSVCVAFGARGLAATPAGPLVVHRRAAKRTLKRPHAIIEAYFRRSSRPLPRPTSITNGPAQGHQQPSMRHSGQRCSVDGRAMHMELPDGIGREAGSGKTRHAKELSRFRACPW